MSNTKALTIRSKSAPEQNKVRLWEWAFMVLFMAGMHWLLSGQLKIFELLIIVAFPLLYWFSTHMQSRSEPFFILSDSHLLYRDKKTVFWSIDKSRLSHLEILEGVHHIDLTSHQALALVHCVDGESYSFPQGVFSEQGLKELAQAIRALDQDKRDCSE